MSAKNAPEMTPDEERKAVEKAVAEEYPIDLWPTVKRMTAIRDALVTAKLRIRELEDNVRYGFLLQKADEETMRGLRAELAEAKGERDAARDGALEEAAKICENECREIAGQIGCHTADAWKIRSLITQESKT